MFLNCTGKARSATVILEAGTGATAYSLWKRGPYPVEISGGQSFGEEQSVYSGPRPA